MSIGLGIAAGAVLAFLAIEIAERILLRRLDRRCSGVEHRQYVVVIDGRVLTSLDGEIWIERTIPEIERRTS